MVVMVAAAATAGAMQSAYVCLRFSPLISIGCMWGMCEYVYGEVHPD